MTTRSRQTYPQDEGERHAHAETDHDPGSSADTGESTSWWSPQAWGFPSEPTSPHEAQSRWPSWISTVTTIAAVVLIFLVLLAALFVECVTSLMRSIS